MSNRENRANDFQGSNAWLGKIGNPPLQRIPCTSQMRMPELDCMLSNGLRLELKESGW